MSDTPAIEFRQLQQLVGIVHKRGSRVMHELAPAIAESLVNEVLEVFETEGHGLWPGFAKRTLSTRTLKPRARNKDGTLKRTKSGKLVKRKVKNAHPKLLQDTGNLVGSITPAWDDDAAEAYTNVPYAKYHVSREPRSVIPLRDFFDIDRESFEADVADMILLRLDRDVAAE